MSAKGRLSEWGKSKFRADFYTLDLLKDADHLWNTFF